MNNGILSYEGVVSCTHYILMLQKCSEFFVNYESMRAHEPSASEETMYGYSAEGELKKRTLNPGDIARIQDLYGK